MPLHLTKIAFDCADVAELSDWLASHATDVGGPGEARLTTRYLPKRHEEMVGGSLYWIHAHVLVGRSPLLGFEQRPDGKWHIRLEPRLVAIETRPRRAHQGWRYLAAEDAPADLPEGFAASDALPPALISELAKLGLV